MAAGISGCALKEMSDGRIEVLVEERDAATREGRARVRDISRRKSGINGAVRQQKTRKGNWGGQEDWGNV